MRDANFELQDGLYFGMSDDVYHSIPRLSASGIKRMLVSPMDFWAWSWMNPNKPAPKSEALVIGRAYHTRILEGREAFNALYAHTFMGDVLDEGTLDTIQQMKDVLLEQGIKLKSDAKKEDYMKAIRELDMGYKFAGDDRARYYAEHAGKTFLSYELIMQIEIAASMIERHGQLSKAVSDGYPEVTILWTCKETGVKMKARIDYLKVKAITDLKTFTNKLNKKIDKALYHAMAAEKYHIQSGVYYEADTYAREFANQGLVFGEVSEDFLNAYRLEKDPTFVFIFQQKGVAPVTRGKIMPKHSTHDLAMVAIREAQVNFANCLDVFGTDPWLDTEAITEFNDAEFPAFISDL